LSGEEDWDNSQFPQTVYTNMYENIVHVGHPSVFLGNVIAECDKECCDNYKSEQSGKCRPLSGMDEKSCNSKYLGFLKSFFLYFYAWFLSFFNYDEQVDECGLNSAECGKVGKMEDCDDKNECPKKSEDPLIGHDLGNPLVNLSIMTLRGVNVLSFRALMILEPLIHYLAMHISANLCL
jgi:hypothetical protein